MKYLGKNFLKWQLKLTTIFQIREIKNSMFAIFLLSFFIHCLFCRTQKEIAQDISNICEQVLIDERSFSDLWEMKKALNNQFYGETEKGAQQLVAETIDEIEKISEKVEQVQDFQSVITAVDRLLRDDQAQVIQDLLKRSFRFVVFFMNVYDSNFAKKVYPPNFPQQETNQNSNQQSDESEIESLNFEEMRKEIERSGNLTRNSIKLLNLLKKKEKPLTGDNIDILVRKLELEWMKVISKEVNSHEIY
jgi:hypothetical protein